jgi:hypothetical protein
MVPVSKQQRLDHTDDLALKGQPYDSSGQRPEYPNAVIPIALKGQP